MSDHSIQFEASGGGLALTKAILLYAPEMPRNLKPYGSSPEAASAFASIHNVERDGEGRPTIVAGMPLSRAHLRQWTDALGRNIVPELLPDNVLVCHPDMLAWWTPAQVRLAYFALSHPPEGLRVLASRSVLRVPYPAHVFVATRSGLRVYALPSSERPAAATRLLHSPILNVFVDGSLCWGNIPKPKGLGIAAIADYERAVFDSWSTHPNLGQELTVRGRGGLVGLWDELAARQARRFPVSRLKPFENGARSRSRIPPGTGGVVGEMTLGLLIGMLR
ncbi:MAG: PRTRC system protein B [Novosphingobium sp.]